MTGDALPSADLAPGYRIPRLIRGGWQWHQRAAALDRGAALDDLMAGWTAGLVAVEAADTYDGVEELLGAFRAMISDRNGSEAAASLRVHTRVSQIGDVPLTRQAVRAVVDRSRQRLRQNRLDLVQLQWWNLACPGWLEAGLALAELRHEGSIAEIGVTNLPAASVSALLDAGVPVRNCQVQISLIDRRAHRRLAPLCAIQGLRLLGYGPLAGGFLTEAWLGRADPGMTGPDFGPVYRRLIARGGGWDWFQGLLAVLDGCARRHRTNIAAVALAWVLGQKMVAAVLVGLSDAGRLARYRQAFALDFAPDEIAAIMAILESGSAIDGDVADMERAEMQGAIAQSYGAAGA